MNAKFALIAALLAVGLALVSAAERAEGTIPVEAEDAELSALDAEADEALHLVGTGRPGRVQAAEESFDALDAEMGVNGLNLAHNLDLSMPVDEDSAEDHVGEEEALDEDVALVAEAESVSIAVADDAADSAESASAAVDSDENASFLQVSEEEESEDESESEEESEDEESDESEDESESESEEESEEEESDSADDEEEAIEAALIVIEADVASDSDAESEADAMTDAGVELVADAAAAQAAAATNVASATIADEDVSAEAASAVDMAEVTDFDTAKLAAKEQEVVRTAGAVSAGLADATIEASGVAADAAPYDADVVAVVSDKLARTAAGAPAFVETGAQAAAEADMPFTPPTEQQQAEEQQHLDLMHSILIQLRKEQGRPLNDEMTPADMDAIEEKMSTLSLVELSAAADTETAAAAAAGAATGAAADADAAHPRDHTVLVTQIVPEVQDTTPGAKLSPATIVKPRREVKPPRDPFRWDIQYRADKRQFMPHDHVELVENAHPLHRRDPTAPTKLKKPVKPAVWDRRPWDTTPKQQYRYDVTYEKRSACCRRREACCVRGVDTKTVVAKVKKPVRIIDPSKPEPQPQPKLKAKKVDKKKADKKKAKMVKPKSYRYDVEFEGQRAKCCAAKSACCAPPQAMYRADVQYMPGGSADSWVVVSGSGERGVVVEVDADELEMLSRIQQRQALLHKLLLTHDSPYYYDDHFDGVAVVPADAAHIVQFHEPRAARDPQQLTVAEQAELNAWMAQLPVVPHLSVVEVGADAHAAQGAVFLQTEESAEAEEASERRLVPARVLKGFVDVQQQPTNLASLLAALPPMPAAAEEQVDEMEDALAQAEADSENDDL